MSHPNNSTFSGTQVRIIGAKEPYSYGKVYIGKIGKVYGVASDLCGIYFDDTYPHLFKVFFCSNVILYQPTLDERINAL